MYVAKLTKYPVKSMTGHDLAAAEFGGFGIAGDRRWAVVYTSGVVATRRELPQLAQLHAVQTDLGVCLSWGEESIDIATPDLAPVSAKIFSTTVEGVHDAGNFAAHFLSSALKIPVRLVYFPDTPLRAVRMGDTDGEHYTGFADGFPALVVSQPSLNALNEQLETAVDMQRFRPNIVIDGDFAAWAEDSWRVLRLGSVILRLVKACERCVMVTQDPETGIVLDKREPLGALRRIHRASNGKIMFGQNAVVEQQGVVRVGDDVEVLEVGPSNLTHI